MPPNSNSKSSKTRYKEKFSGSDAINLIYIRAAIESATGQRLPLDQIRELLVDEGLITASQARHHAKIFTGYHEYYNSISGEADKNEEPPQDMSPYDETLRTWPESG